MGALAIILAMMLGILIWSHATPLLRVLGRPHGAGGTAAPGGEDREL